MILGAEAKECVALIADSAPGCERPRGAVSQALCPAWFTGDAAIGAACDFPICGGGQGLCVAGTCVVKPAVGEPCGPGGACAVGLLCIADQCAAPVGVGGACASDDACAPPLRCIAGACSALNDVGGACVDASACAPGLMCDAGACKARPMGACSADAPCGNLDFCATPRRCIVRGGPRARAAAKEGCGLLRPGCAVRWARAWQPRLDKPCVNGVLCAAELACDTDNGSCKPLPGAGQACGFAIDKSYRMCARRRWAASTMCAGRCRSPASCARSTIAARRGSAATSRPTENLCVPLKDVGGACQADRTCPSGSIVITRWGNAPGCGRRVRRARTATSAALRAPACRSAAACSRARRGRRRGSAACW